MPGQGSPSIRGIPSSIPRPPYADKPVGGELADAATEWVANFQQASRRLLELPQCNHARRVGGYGTGKSPKINIILFWDKWLSLVVRPFECVRAQTDLFNRYAYTEGGLELWVLLTLVISP